jgi:hypothetical protein
MARKPKTSTGRSRWRAVAAVFAILVLAAGLLLAFDRLGSEALRGIGPRDRYRKNFNDISSDTPPGMDPHKFLAEVRYVSGFPEVFNALDESEREKLAAAFAAHPWVAAVKGVTLSGTSVKVSLKFRVAVLAVPVRDGPTRLVDEHGILLPESPPPAGIARLITVVQPPTVAAGQVWPDPDVRRAVSLVEAYKPATLERTATDWRIVMADGKTLHATK